MAAWHPNTHAATTEVAAVAAPVRQVVSDRARVAAPQRRRRGGGFLGWLIGAGFWMTLISLTISAAAAPGFIIFALLPIAGLPYLLFCWIAVTGDRNVED